MRRADDAPAPAPGKAVQENSPEAVADQGQARDLAAESKTDPAEFAANTLFDLAHQFRAIADLVDDVSDEQSNETLSTCVRTMLPEIYRQIDEAAVKLGQPIFGGFVDAYFRRQHEASAEEGEVRHG